MIGPVESRTSSADARPGTPAVKTSASALPAIQRRVAAGLPINAFRSPYLFVGLRVNEHMVDADSKLAVVFASAGEPGWLEGLVHFDADFDHGLVPELCGRNRNAAKRWRGLV